MRFEAVLAAGFSLEILRYQDLTDPRVTYILHELGEETRHSRLFVRMIEQLAPCARNPIDTRIITAVQNRILPRLMRRPAFFCVLVLTGEEIPDLYQKLRVRTSRHRPVHPGGQSVSPARGSAAPELRAHVAARVVGQGDAFERFQIRHVAPLLLEGMFDMLVHPGVYETVGLPGWATWKRVKATPERMALRHQALRPVAQALVDAGALRPGRIPKRWQHACGIDASGTPLT